MDSIGTEQLTKTSTSMRRVAIIGAPPGLGLRPTLIASSPRFHPEPRLRTAEPHRPSGLGHGSAAVAALPAHPRAAGRRFPRLRGPRLRPTIAVSPL